MTLLAKPLKLIGAQRLDALFKLRKVLIGLMVISLGVLLGHLYSSSQETAELTVSIIVVIILMALIINRPLNGLLVLLVLMPFLEQYVEIPMGAGIPDLSFSRFAIAFLFVFMLARAAVGGFRFATPIGLAEICILATIIGVGSSATLVDDPNIVIRDTITRYFTPLIIYFFARNLVRDQEDLHKLLWAIMIFGLAAAIYAIYEQSTGHVLFVAKEVDASQLRTDYTESLYLLRGLLERAPNFGRVFLSTIPVSFYLFFEHKAANRKLLLIGGLAVQFYGLFLTYNRTSWYALLISLVIMQFFYPQFRKVFFVIVFVAVIILWATWGQVNNSAVVEERLNHKTDSFNGRTEIWEAGLKMWQLKPIRGWGFGAFEEKSGRFRTDGFRTNFNSIENDYLHIMVSTGLIGFLPYLLFLLAPLVNSLRLFFFRMRAPNWSGFIKPETITIYWCVVISLAIGGYTQVISVPVVKMLPFALAGAIVGTHQHWLHRSRNVQFEMTD